MDRPHLRSLPFLARLGLTAALGVLAIGAWASLLQIENHHAKNDGEEGLSLVDLRGAYHGVDVPARLGPVLEADPPHTLFLEDDERAGLLDWLNGDNLIDGFDDFDLDQMAPVAIFERRCIECHSTDQPEGGVSLEYWEDVERVVQSKQITPTPWKILVMSVHTHATGVGTLVVLIGVLACWTRFGGFLRALPLGLGGIGLFLDIGCQLLARQAEFLVSGVLVGGAMFGTGLALGFLLVFLELWLPARNAD